MRTPQYPTQIDASVDAVNPKRGVSHMTCRGHRADGTECGSVAKLNGLCPAHQSQVKEETDATPRR